MYQEQAITLDPNPHPALSYAGLRAEDLELLGRLCGDQWSDFNSHDPGITILEQLCFALTELAYRSQWSIEDLLASAGPDWQPAAQEILGGDPVTRDDLSALVRALGCEAVRVEALDQPDLPLYFRPSTSASALPEGAQTKGLPPVAGDLELEPDLASGFGASPQPAVVPRGVWRVAAQLGAMEQGSGPVALLPIAQRLHGVRLLGRDFAFEVLDPFAVVVRAELEVDPAQATSDLMLRLQTCLDQAIRRAGADDNGGGLRSGALIQVLLALPEVRQVTDFLLAISPDVDEDDWQRWHLPLPGGGARLHPASSLSLFHRGVRLAVPIGELRQAPPRPALAEPAPFGLPTSEPPPSSLRPSDAGAAAVASPGRRRTLTSNRSLALELPAVYGVGLAGLPAGASPERQQQARQLRTYLHFFDQLLANGQDQLARAIPLLSPVEAGASVGEVGHRQALLAHLLQRFGEELSLAAQLPAGSESLVQARSEFLRRIVPLSGGRGSGPDLLADVPDQLGEDGQGAFAERLRRKLGLPLAADGSPPLLVIEHLLLRPLPDDSSQRVQGGEDPIPFLADVARPDPWSARVSVVINAAVLPPWPADAPADACDHWLVNVLRQELPAHLVAELHLLADAEASPGQGPWSAMVTAWCGFRDQLRAQRLAGLGAQGAQGAEDDLAKRLLSLRLRDRRDRLLSLLGIGLPWPLRGIPFKEEQVMVATGKSAAIELRYSQPGVSYQLVEVASGAAVGEAAAGNDGPLILTTPAISRDLILRVQASVLPPSPVATANGRLRSTLVVGEILVVEGVDPGLPLRLLDLTQNPLPLLHPEGAALLAHHGQRLLVEMAASQEGVVYEVIDNAQRKTPFANQKPLSAKVTGTSGPIVLELTSPADEDQDLTVRATLDRQRGRAKSEDRQVLLAVLPLRVRANADVSITLARAVLEPEEQSLLLVGDARTPSQSSVSYKAWSLPFTIDDLLFLDDLPQPAGQQINTLPPVLDGQLSLPPADRRLRTPVLPAPADPTLTGWIGRGQPKKGTDGQQKAGNEGQLQLSLGQAKADTYLAVIASKQHSLGPAGSTWAGTSAASQVLIKQLVSQLIRPDPSQRLALVADTAGIDATGVGSVPSRWLLHGGEPGCLYSFLARGDGQPLALPVYVHRQTADSPPAARGIGWLRLELDLALAGASGPALETKADLAALRAAALRVSWAHTDSSVNMRLGPLWVTVEPSPVAAAGSATVKVWGLQPNEQAKLMLQKAVLAAPQAGSQDPAKSIDLVPGPLAQSTVLDLVITSDESSNIWKFPVVVDVTQPLG
jgi:hypothetical protein